MQEQEMKFYNIFINNHPPQDFLKLLTNNNNSPPKQKETDDGININSHLKFLEDGPMETDSRVGERQYTDPNHSLSQSIGTRSSNPEMGYAKTNQIQSANTKGKRKQIFFEDMMNDRDKTPEMKSFNSENDSIRDNNQHTPVYYANSPLPPGLLTPTKYAQYVKELQVNIKYFILN